MRPCLLLPLLSLLPPSAGAADKFELRDGDRVVWIGNTLVEREQRYGYWETLLTQRYPDRHITFRNLGWSGDTVWSEARASFDPPEKGFQRLIAGVKGLKPTVLFICYGTNESFEGAQGLPRFRQGLERLLDALAPTKARVVLFSPLPMESLGSPLPDATTQNKNLELYAKEIGNVAEKRGHYFADLFSPVHDMKKARPLTDNGLHLTEYGYWATAPLFEKALGLKTQHWMIDINSEGKFEDAGCKITNVKASKTQIAFEVKDDILPPPTFHRGWLLEGRRRIFRARGLQPGNYILTVDNLAPSFAASELLSAGIPLGNGPDFLQQDRLRATIIEKNRLYFHRWRPQNETYLFGFRKQEQGQNGREIPLFDPLVEAQEKEIARLRVPVARKYELKRD